MLASKGLDAALDVATGGDHATKRCHVRLNHLNGHAVLGDVVEERCETVGKGVEHEQLLLGHLHGVIVDVGLGKKVVVIEGETRSNGEQGCLLHVSIHAHLATISVIHVIFEYVVHDGLQ